MITPPPIRYSRRDDAHIAFQMVGDGPLDAIVFGTGTAPIESLWDLPAAVDFIEKVSGFTRLILFDRAGIGSSDPLQAGERFSSEGHAADAAAVLDELGCSDVLGIGLGMSSAAAMCLAADRPHLVSRLALFNSTARFLVADDYPIGADPQHNEVRTDAVIWGDTDMFLSVMAPSALADNVYRGWYEVAGRRGASPAVAEALIRSMYEIDVRDVVGGVAASTLLLHTRRNRLTPLTHAEYLDARLADARLVVLEGADVMPFVGDFDSVSEEIEEFVTGVRRGPMPTQQLAVLMFTDIVDSTARAAEAGDRQWHEIMDRHDLLVQHTVERFGGKIIKSTGDGQLVTFGTPSSTLRAVVQLFEVIEENLGLALRAGIHLGEFETRGSDVSGLAVNVAARVADLAGPGEIWMTDSTRRATLGSEFHLEAAGTHELKGVPDKWELCRLVGDPLRCL